MDVGSSLALDQIFLHVISDFFLNFFNVSKGPLQFLIFCNRMDVQEIPERRVPLSYFFCTMRLTGDFKKSKRSEFFLRGFVVSSCGKKWLPSGKKCSYPYPLRYNLAL